MKKAVCAAALALTFGAPGTYAQEKTGVIRRPDYLLFVPAGLQPAKKYPLVVALSPGGNAGGVIARWKPLAQKRRWIVLASRKHRNGIDVEPIFAELAGDVRGLIKTQPIDPARIIASGVSGGGMGAHFLAYRYPDLFSAVIVNTGMIHPDYRGRGDSYPRGKLAVFLASPTDPCYDQMKRDREFLSGLDWETDWIEFEGGHRPAPSSSYDEAASWLEEKFLDRD